jgi:hypothetical protein
MNVRGRFGGSRGVPNVTHQNLKCAVTSHHDHGKVILTPTCVAGHS